MDAFERVMQRIDDSGIHRVLAHKALDEMVPVMGNCCGVELLTGDSYDSRRPVQSWIQVPTKHCSILLGLKVLHMDLNPVRAVKSHPPTQNLKGYVSRRVGHKKIILTLIDV